MINRLKNVQSYLDGLLRPQSNTRMKSNANMEYIIAEICTGPHLDLYNMGLLTNLEIIYA